jgi:hypothetical protein
VVTVHRDCKPQIFDDSASDGFVQSIVRRLKDSQSRFSLLNTFHTRFGGAALDKSLPHLLLDCGCRAERVICSACGDPGLKARFGCCKYARTCVRAVILDGLMQGWNPISIEFLRLGGIGLWCHRGCERLICCLQRVHHLDDDSEKTWGCLVQVCLDELLCICERDTEDGI